MFRPNYVSSLRRLLVLFVFLLRTAVTDSEKGHPQCAPRYTQQREAERYRTRRARRRRRGIPSWAKTLRAASARTRNRKMMQCVRPESELESKSEREEIPARRPTILARPPDPLIIQMMFKRVALALFSVAARTKQAVVNFAQVLHLTYAQYSLQITVGLDSALSHLAISH
jgi:hypothetical protein